MKMDDKSKIIEKIVIELGTQSPEFCDFILKIVNSLKKTKNISPALSHDKTQSVQE